MHNRVWVLSLLATMMVSGARCDRGPSGSTDAPSTTATAQQDDVEPVTISIYHVAPGQHLAFLSWMADREQIAAEAGAPTTQWYVHLSGDSWDYLAIAPPTTDAQDDAIERIASARGLTVGPAAAIEFRTMIASHTDTEAAGPLTAAEIVSAIRSYDAE